MFAYNQGFLTFSSVSTQDFAQPTWARLECQPTDAYEPSGGVKTEAPNNGAWFDCKYNTDFCDVFIDATSPSWWSGSDVFVYYKKCIIGGTCDPEYNFYTLKEGQTDYKIPQPLTKGQTYHIYMEKDIFGPINPNTQFVAYTKFRPWKIYRYVGGQKTVAKSSDCCFASANENFLSKIPIDSPMPPCLTMTGEEGSKYINYVDNWVKGYASNVYNHPKYGEVYCSGGRIYDIVELTTKNGKLTKIDPSYINTNADTTKYLAKGQGKLLSGVDCCPQDPYCGLDFKINPKPTEGKSCFTDAQCFNGGAPVPIDKNSYKIERCTEDICTWSSAIKAECTNSVACPKEKPICDLSTNNYGKCVKSQGYNYCGDGICDARTESKTSCEIDCGKPIINSGRCKNCFDWAKNLFKSKENQCESIPMLTTGSGWTYWINPLDWSKSLINLTGLSDQKNICPFYLIFFVLVVVVLLFVSIIILSLFGIQLLIIKKIFGAITRRRK